MEGAATVEKRESETEASEKDEQPKEDKQQEEPVKLGPMVFNSGTEMFTFFYDLLHDWPADMDLNEYEHLVMADLISKGHNDPEKKVGVGIKAFLIRFHPKWRSKCYYLVRNDGSSDDFSYRKCVDNLMKLPPELFLPNGNVKHENLSGNRNREVHCNNKRGGGRGGWHGRGRGGGRAGGSRGGRGRGRH